MMEEEFEKLAKQLREVGPLAVEAIKEVVDKRADSCFEYMRDHTPIRTGGLQSSLKKSKVDRPDKYGYLIDYVGYNAKGQPYSVIARALNRGDSLHPGTRHIDAAVHKLKGMDVAIEKVFVKKLNKNEKAIARKLKKAGGG